jgi:NADH:ubiquinone oxidoreductase subunit F (NADH-binding)
MPREQIDEWLDTMASTSICGLGQAAPVPVRGALQHWPELLAELGKPR